MPHNSLFILGLVSNQMWLHGIQADKRIDAEKCEEELAFEGVRISLTFRKIATFLAEDEQTIWGQGATGKTKEEARETINGNADETQRMINAFGTENQEDHAWDWDKTYGGGFDVLHFRKE